MNAAKYFKSYTWISSLSELLKKSAFLYIVLNDSLYLLFFFFIIMPGLIYIVKILKIRPELNIFKKNFSVQKVKGLVAGMDFHGFKSQQFTQWILRSAIEAKCYFPYLPWIFFIKNIFTCRELGVCFQFLFLIIVRVCRVQFSRTRRVSEFLRKISADFFPLYWCSMNPWC